MSVYDVLSYLLTLAIHKSEEMVHLQGKKRPSSPVFQWRGNVFRTEGVSKYKYKFRFALKSPSICTNQ